MAKCNLVNIERKHILSYLILIAAVFFQYFHNGFFPADDFIQLGTELQAKHLLSERASFSYSVIGVSRKKANETGKRIDCGHMTVVQSCILWMKPLELPVSFVKLYKIASPHDSICYSHFATGLFQKKSKQGELRIYFSERPPGNLSFVTLFTLPQEILEKKAFTLGNSANLCYTRSKFQS